MANFNPLGYTGKVPASLTRLGVCQFNPVDFNVDESGVVSLGGTGAVQTINSLLPTAGNIVIAGTAAQITATSVGSTITLSLPAIVTAPGSLATTTTLASGTTLTAGTGITSTTGNIVASAGNISATLGSVAAGTTVTAGTDLVSTAGNVLIQGAAKQLRVEGGAVTDFIGQATLVAGTVTIANTNIAAGDRVFVSRSDLNGSTALGLFDVSITPATNFIIDSRKPADATIETNDVSIVDYFIVRQL